MSDHMTLDGAIIHPKIVRAFAEEQMRRTREAREAACAHCWHRDWERCVVGVYSLDVCCHCDARREWRASPPVGAAHGPYVPGREPASRAGQTVPDVMSTSRAYINSCLKAWGATEIDWAALDARRAKKGGDAGQTAAKTTSERTNEGATRMTLVTGAFRPILTELERIKRAYEHPTTIPQEMRMWHDAYCRIQVYHSSPTIGEMVDAVYEDVVCRINPLIAHTEGTYWEQRRFEAIEDDDRESRAGEKSEPVETRRKAAYAREQEDMRPYYAETLPKIEAAITAIRGALTAGAETGV